MIYYTHIKAECPSAQEAIPMIQALFQTISNFFVDLPSINELFDNIFSGEIDFLGGFVSMLKGLFGGEE